MTPDFSIYFFGDYPQHTPQDTPQDDKYAIILESARFADTHGFHALWIPERHFHSFGGVFPNPSVLAAALARETQRIRLHAGCVVLPLHHPVRVAEEWSMIDNLSGGRVGLGCASGWHANDFVFCPENFGRHKAVMYEHIETIRRLWRGEPLTARSGSGQEIDVRLYPKPLQPAPPFFTAIVGNPESYRLAAQHDLGVISNLMTQTIEQLADNIQLYRRSRTECGLDPNAGKVVVLLHTYMGEDVERTRVEAFDPFCRYLRSSLSLFGQVTNSLGFTIDFENTPEEDLQFVLWRAYERYCESRALIGTPDSCAPIVDALVEIGVDEIACFIDFGMSLEQVRRSLPVMDALARRYQADAPVSDTGSQAGSEPVVEAGPLSAVQERMWSFSKRFPGFTTANEPKAIRLEGQLDVEALRASLRQLVKRHAALRTVFREVDGEPRQLVLARMDVDCPVINREGADEREVVRQAIDEEGKRLFDLTQGPLLVTYLLRFSATRHVLIVSVHHIVFDAVSALIFTRELSACYRSWLRGQPAALPELPMTYIDYAREERTAINGEKARQDLAFWLNRLGQDPPVLRLPTDHPRPAVRSFNGQSFFMTLTPQLSEEIRRFSQRQRATLFMTLLAGFAAMLHKFSGQDDILVGTAVANRRDDTEDLVGIFVNMVGLRMAVDGDPTFLDLLSQVRATTLEAYEHQELPFTEVAKAVNRQGDTPIFQVVIEFENDAIYEFDLPGVKATLLDVAVTRAPYELTLYLVNRPDGIQCYVEYNSDLFEERTVRRFVRYFHQLLDVAVRQPDLPLSQLSDLIAEDHAVLQQ